MDKKETQSKLMDYLYDEMDRSERQQFEEILAQNSGLRQELNEMQSTHKLLQEEPGEIPNKNLLLIQTPSSEKDSDKRTQSKPARLFSLKSAAAIAAATLIAVSVFSLANLQITHSDEGTMISFGNTQSSVTEQPENYITQDEFYVLMSELQDQNSQVMIAALEQSRQEHQQQMQDVIEVLTTYYDRRRQQDLLLVSEGLAQLEQESYYRYLQTEEALEDLILALNIQQYDE